jgi:hypothetical protein
LSKICAFELAIPKENQSNAGLESRSDAPLNARTTLKIAVRSRSNTPDLKNCKSGQHLTASRKLGNLKELLQMEAIGTSVGFSHYCVLLPAFNPAAYNFCARGISTLAYINQPTKLVSPMQVFFSNILQGDRPTWSEYQTVTRSARVYVTNLKIEGERGRE